MCSVAMNFSKLAICFIVRVCVRCKTVSSEHGMSGATTYSFASTSGGAHGRSDIGTAGAGFAFRVDKLAAGAFPELSAGFDAAGEAFSDEVDAGTRLLLG